MTDFPGFQNDAFQDDAFQEDANELVPIPNLRINGFYVDKKGSLQYYYVTPDGQNGPKPTQT